jgi:peroxiredoxin
MKFSVDMKMVGAVCFALLAFGILVSSVRSIAPADSGDSALIPTSDAQQVKDFQLTDAMTNRSVRLADLYKQGPVVFSFWATWCQYCPQELTRLQAYSEKYHGRIQFIGVDSHDGIDNIKAFCSKYRLNMPMLQDSGGTIAQEYGIDSLPHMYIVDRSGRIRLNADGYDEDMDNKIPKLLDQLVKEDSVELAHSSPMDTASNG